jgi:hypothetical protein
MRGTFGFVGLMLIVEHLVNREQARPLDRREVARDKCHIDEITDAHRRTHAISIYFSGCIGAGSGRMRRISGRLVKLLWFTRITRVIGPKGYIAPTSRDCNSQFIYLSMQNLRRSTAPHIRGGIRFWPAGGHFRNTTRETQKLRTDHCWF